MTKTKTVNAIFTIILIAICSAGARIIHDVGIIADEYGLSGHWMKLDRLYIILITAILLIVLNVIFFFKKSNKIGRLVLYSINVAVIVSGIFIICNLKTDIHEFIETKPLPAVEIAVDSLDEILKRESDVSDRIVLLNTDAVYPLYDKECCYEVENFYSYAPVRFISRLREERRAYGNFSSGS